MRCPENARVSSPADSFNLMPYVGSSVDLCGRFCLTLFVSKRQMERFPVVANFIDKQEVAAGMHKLEDIGGKMETKKIELIVSSKVGALDNVRHKPQGDDKKIFDDEEYLRQMSAVTSIEHS
nr:unnamed protein product [Callosobruchus analis]